MTNFLKAVVLGTTAIAATTVVATPALAQRNAPATQGTVATADIDAAVQQSAAFTLAVTQIQTTYAAQIQARQTRATALQAELQPLAAAAQAEQARTPRNETALQNAVRAFQTRQAAAQQEIQTLSQPIDLALAYTREQITLRLAEAVRAAASTRGVQVLLTNEAVIWRADTADMTAAVVTELNRLVPNVQIVPPTGYQPGSLIRAQQQAAAGAAAPAAATPAPAAPAAPQTR